MNVMYETFTSIISFHFIWIGCSFKFILKVGVEESIVNAPFVSLQNAKSEVRLNSWSVLCNPWCVHIRLFNFEEKFKWTPGIINTKLIYIWIISTRLSKKNSNQIKFEFFYFCNNKHFLLIFNSSNLFIFHFDWNIWHRILYVGFD
jgi:hypothetical protein